MIGRDQELAALLRCWDDTTLDPPRIATVIGAAGMGKSRLLLEFVERLALVSRVHIVRARCMSYGQSVHLSFIGSLVRTLLEVAEGDPVPLVRRRLRSFVGNVLRGEGTERRAIARDVLGELLGLGRGRSTLRHSDADVRRRELVKVLALALAAQARGSPAIFLFDDLHWLDQGSCDLLTGVLAAIPRLPLLFLTAQRQEWIAPWSRWESTTTLQLCPLKPRDADLLAQTVLGGVPLSANLKASLAVRAEGNPFFVEELLRTLRTMGGLHEVGGSLELVPGIEDHLPETLTGLLLTRLDRLEEGARNLVQAASVLGRSFSLNILARVVGEDLPALERSLSVMRDDEIAFPVKNDGSSEPRYIFKHPTIREVAYNTLLHGRQRELHGAVARAMVQMYPAQEFVHAIAYHFSHSDDPPDALHWLERSGDSAARMGSNNLAVQSYRKAIQIGRRLHGNNGAVTRVERKLREAERGEARALA